MRSRVGARDRARPQPWALMDRLNRRSTASAHATLVAVPEGRASTVRYLAPLQGQDAAPLGLGRAAAAGG